MVQHLSEVGGGGLDVHTRKIEQIFSGFVSQVVRVVYLSRQKCHHV